MTDTLMTTDVAAANTSEGEAASNPPVDTTTEVVDAGNQQQPEGVDAEAKPAEAKPEGAPEKYEFTAPDGHEFSPEALAAFESEARRLNLSQGDAQEMLGKLAPAIHQAQVARIDAIKSEWAETAKADKEFGGEKFGENLAVAKKALDRFGSPEFTALLNETGLGNHPEFIRAFVKAGRAISEDGYVGGNAKTAPSDPAKVLFPSMN